MSSLWAISGDGLLQPLSPVAGLCTMAGLGLHKGQAVQNRMKLATESKDSGTGSLGFRFKETQENINQMQGDNWGM